MRSNAKPSPVIETARNIRDGRKNQVEVILPTGDRALLKPVTASLIDAVTSRIKDPQPPMWYNKEYEREEPNLSHPDYLAGLEEANRQRGIAAMDAMVMFGVELIDGVPEDDTWLKKLRFMEKHGMIDLSGYNLDDPLDQEFLYKRYVAVDSEIITKISEVSGISPAEVAAAEDSFQSN